MNARLETPSELVNVAVLVVDDDADARGMLVDALGGCGARVIDVSSAAAALDAVTRDRPDILFSDIGMPDEDGYSLMRRIRQLPASQGGRIPAAAVTAFQSRADRRRALGAGFQMHLAKPVDSSTIVAAAVMLVRMAAASS